MFDGRYRKNLDQVYFTKLNTFLFLLVTFYAPKNIEDLEKTKSIIKQRKDIKKLKLNEKINKQTLNFNLAEACASITHLQKKTNRSYETRSRRTSKSY